MRLKVPELIRHFDDNLRPKASNLRRIQYRFGTEAPKSVEFAPKILLYFGRCCAQKRRICDEFNIDSELKRPKASNLRRIQYRFGTEAHKSVEFNIDSELKRPKASNLRLKVIILWAQNFYYIIYWKIFITLYLYIDDLCIYSLVFINKAYRIYKYIEIYIYIYINSYKIYKLYIYAIII